MKNRIRRLAVLIGMLVAVSMIGASAALAGVTVSAFKPYNYGNGYMLGGGGVNGYQGTSYEVEPCLQVYNPNGNWYTINGSCFVSYPNGGEEVFSALTPFTHGHTYRTWVWAAGVGTATSGNWTP